MLGACKNKHSYTLRSKQYWKFFLLNPGIMGILTNEQCTCLPLDIFIKLLSLKAYCPAPTAYFSQLFFYFFFVANLCLFVIVRSELFKNGKVCHVFTISINCFLTLKGFKVHLSLSQQSSNLA